MGRFRIIWINLEKLFTTREQGRLIERPLHQEFVDRNDRRVKKDMRYYKKRQELNLSDRQAGTYLRPLNDSGTWITP
jgi:hypothetical protein